MPLYEYECTDCGHLTEALQRLGDPPLSKCPRCGGPLKKLLSAPAFQFKGSGWYVTDYARKGGGGAEATNGAAKGDSSAAAADGGGEGGGSAKAVDKPAAKQGTEAKGSSSSSGSAKQG